MSDDPIITINGRRAYTAQQLAERRGWTRIGTVWSNRSRGRLRGPDVVLPGRSLWWADLEPDDGAG